MRFTITALTNDENTITEVIDQIAPGLSPYQKLMFIKWLAITRLEIEVDLIQSMLKAGDPHGYYKRRLTTIKRLLKGKYDAPTE